MQDGKKISKKAIERLKEAFVELRLYFETGEEYKRKESTIQEWMNRDEELDKKLERAEPPQLIRCKTCACIMNVESRQLLGFDDDRVLFFFICPNKCLPNRLIYEDGTERKPTPHLCPHCQKETEKISEKRKGAIISVLYKCTFCDRKHTDKIDLTIKEESVDLNFEKDRERFCLSDEKGREYINSINTFKELSEVIEEKKEKEKNKALYDKVTNLKKFIIPQLKAHLTDILKGSVYSNLVFEKPDMARTVSIGFSIEEMKTNNEYDSIRKLTRLLKKGLEETNCRLMSDGISCRLGIFSGRIRVYEDEHELAKILEKRSN